MADFDINGYIGYFKGGARSNLFYFKPMFPSDVGIDMSKQGKFLVRTTSTPDATLEQIITSWQGFDYKMGGKHTFNDITVTFNVDLNAKIRDAYERWITLIHNPLTNYYALPSQYMEDQYMQMLDYQGNVILEFKMYQAFPTTLGAISLDYATVDVAQFDVTFTYQYHTVAQAGTAV